MRFPWMACCCLLATLAGCGTTRWTDTPRTATEQLLISDAMDRAVSRLDLKAMAGRNVFLDASPLANVTDSAYLVSSIRQHMLASGCILKDKREEADYVVEARAGVIGTDKQELMFGVPSVSVPPIAASPVPASTIPEIPIVKRTQQRAVAKIALFAYNAKTGRPVWQSGVIPVESTAKDVWVVGAGPFQRGSIYRGTQLAGNPVDLPLLEPSEEPDEDRPPVAVADEAFFSETAKSAGKDPPKEAATPASASEPAHEKPKPEAGSTDASTTKEVIPASHAASSGDEGASDTKPPAEAKSSSAAATGGAADVFDEPLLDDGPAEPSGLVAPLTAEAPDRVPRVLVPPPVAAPMPPESTTRWAPPSNKAPGRRPAADPSLVLGP